MLEQEKRMELGDCDTKRRRGLEAGTRKEEAVLRLDKKRRRNLEAGTRKGEGVWMKETRKREAET